MSQILALLYAIRDTGKTLSLSINGNSTVTAKLGDKEFTSDAADVESAMLQAIVGVLTID